MGASKMEKDECATKMTCFLSHFKKKCATKQTCFLSHASFVAININTTKVSSPTFIAFHSQSITNMEPTAKRSKASMTLGERAAEAEAMVEAQKRAWSKKWQQHRKELKRLRQQYTTDHQELLDTVKARDEAAVAATHELGKAQRETDKARHKAKVALARADDQYRRLEDRYDGVVREYANKVISFVAEKADVVKAGKKVRADYCAMSRAHAVLTYELQQTKKQLEEKEDADVPVPTSEEGVQLAAAKEAMMVKCTTCRSDVNTRTTRTFGLMCDHQSVKAKGPIDFPDPDCTCPGPHKCMSSVLAQVEIASALTLSKFRLCESCMPAYIVREGTLTQCQACNRPGKALVVLIPPLE